MCHTPWVADQALARWRSSATISTAQGATRRNGREMCSATTPIARTTPWNTSSGSRCSRTPGCIFAAAASESQTTPLQSPAAPHTHATQAYVSRASQAAAALQQCSRHWRRERARSKRACGGTAAASGVCDDRGGVDAVGARAVRHPLAGAALAHVSVGPGVTNPDVCRWPLPWPCSYDDPVTAVVHKCGCQQTRSRAAAVFPDFVLRRQPSAVAAPPSIPLPNHPPEATPPAAPHWARIYQLGLLV